MRRFPVWVGSNPPEATSKPFHGVIDEVKIYTRALSASELQAEMNTPVGPTNIYPHGHQGGRWEWRGERARDCLWNGLL